MYIEIARPVCLKLLVQEILRAFSRASANTGNSIAARMAIIAITTSRSISVKPLLDEGLMPGSFHGPVRRIDRLWRTPAQLNRLSASGSPSRDSFLVVFRVHCRRCRQTCSDPYGHAQVDH